MLTLMAFGHLVVITQADSQKYGDCCLGRGLGEAGNCPVNEGGTDLVAGCRTPSSVSATPDIQVQRSVDDPVHKIVQTTPPKTPNIMTWAGMQQQDRGLGTVVSLPGLIHTIDVLVWKGDP